MSIVDILKKYDNKLLQNESKGLELFNNLKHDKSSLDFFLKYVIAEILITSKKILICSSNEELVKKFSTIKNEGATLEKVMRVPFDTSKNHNILTWDLIKNKYASISGNRWQILNFIVIDKNNIDILHRAITDILKSKKQ